MGPVIYNVELSIGGQQFIGKGRTRQLAKHDAAAKALKVLQKEPILQQLPVVRKEVNSQHLVVLENFCRVFLDLLILFFLFCFFYINIFLFDR